MLHGLFAASVWAGELEPRRWSSHDLRDCFLAARDLSGARKKRALDLDTLVDRLDAWRRERPGLYGPTEPPPSGTRLVPDYEPMGTLHLVIPGYADHIDTYVPLLVHASHQGRVRATVTGRVDVRFLFSLLDHEGADLARIELVPEESLESIWMRDFGPVPVRTPSGPGVLDFAYAPDCLMDDAHPTLSRDGDQKVWRSPVVVDGGNLMTDGFGTCFATDALFVEAALEPAEMERHLERWAGCESVVWLEALRGSGAPHVDMFLTPAPNKVLLVASFERNEDPLNYGIMLRNREKLAALGRWTLVDLPVVPPREESVVRTWNNVLPFNDVLFVPDFDGMPTERVVSAWNRLQDAFPGRTLRAVPSEVLLASGGAVHCIARGEP